MEWAAPATRIQRRALAVAGAATVAVAALTLPLQAWLAAFAAWGRTAGAVGVVAFACVQLACTLLLVPAWPVRVAAGSVWGLAGGFALAYPTSVAGSLLAFAVGRSVLRERVARRVARDPRLAALDGAVAGRGFATVLLLRLSPVVPNEPANYALGLTGVRLRAFALASAAGMAPAVASAVAAGALASSAAELFRGGARTAAPLRTVALAVGVAATGGLALAGVRVARRALAAGGSAGAGPRP